MTSSCISNFFTCIPIIGIPFLIKKMSNEAVYHRILGEIQEISGSEKEIYEAIKNDSLSQKQLIKKYQVSVICGTVQGILSVIAAIALIVLGINFLPAGFIGGAMAFSSIFLLCGGFLAGYGAYSIWKTQDFLNRN